MVLSAYRVLIVLICIGLVSFQPTKVSGLRSRDLVLRESRYYNNVMQRNRRVLEAADTENVSTEKKAVEAKEFDPNRSSKRTFRRGSDPIHNKS